jgi:hypothetical protein
MGKGYADKLCRRCRDKTDPLQDFDWIEDHIDVLNGPEGDAFVEAERSRRIAEATVIQGQLSLLGGEGEASA